MLCADNSKQLEGKLSFMQLTLNTGVAKRNHYCVPTTRCFIGPLCPPTDAHACATIRSPFNNGLDYLYSALPTSASFPSQRRTLSIILPTTLPLHTVPPAILGAPAHSARPTVFPCLTPAHTLAHPLSSPRCSTALQLLHDQMQRRQTCSTRDAQLPRLNQKQCDCVLVCPHHPDLLFLGKQLC